MKFLRIELDNEIEADVFTAILKEEKIPHIVVDHHSMAYDGLFQMTTGWGHIEVPDEYKNKAAELFQNYKKSLAE